MRQSSLTVNNDRRSESASFNEGLVECAYNISQAMQVNGKSIYYSKASLAAEAELQAESAKKLERDGSSGDGARKNNQGQGTGQKQRKRRHRRRRNRNKNAAGSTQSNGDAAPVVPDPK